MRSIDRFDSRLPQLLDELSQPRTPDWFDDFVGLTARTRQRPAWTLPERWIPMTEIARRPVTAPRLPLRSVAIGLLILVLLATAVVFVASRRQAPPPPFGPAKTGLVAFDRNGDIFVADSVDGTERPIVTGPDYDTYPVWSLDGTRIAFERKENSATATALLLSMHADGTGIVELTPEPLFQISKVTFSPDGRELLVTTGTDATSRVYIAQGDGTGIRPLPTAMVAMDPDWHPAEAGTIIFLGVTQPGAVTRDGYPGLYAFDVDTGASRTIVEPAVGKFRGHARPSPDGKRIVYTEWVDAPVLTAETHVVNVDGTNDVVLPLPVGAVWQSGTPWSNDARKLLVIRGYSGGYDQSRAVVAPADASSTGTEIAYPGSINQECCSSWEWAPDDSFILGTPTDPVGAQLQQVILDPTFGTSRTASFSTISYPAIQRLAR
jgi:Tol biopolymer transport system component